MFQVYQRNDDRLEWLGQSDTELRSRLLALMISKRTPLVVIVVETTNDGGVSLRHSFQHGQPVPTADLVNALGI